MTRSVREDRLIHGLMITLCRLGFVKTWRDLYVDAFYCKAIKPIEGEGNQ